MLSTSYLEAVTIQPAATQPSRWSGSLTLNQSALWPMIWSSVPYLTWSSTLAAIDGLLRTLAASTATTARFCGSEVTRVMPTPDWTTVLGSLTSAAQKLVALKSWVILMWPVTVVVAPGARSPPRPQR